MEIKNKLRKSVEVGIVLATTATLLLAGCGGGGGSTPASNTLGGTAAE